MRPRSVQRDEKAENMDLYGFAALTAEQLAAVKAFEAETAKRVLVLRVLDVLPADLRKEEVARLQALEKELGNIILAVR